MDYQKIIKGDKVVLAHMGHFNKESERLYRENSREVCGISGTKDYIDIIELDLRKSKDGILYCYHGTFLEYFFLLKFPNNFSDLQKRYKVDSLQEILSVISEDKKIFLDIKDKNITKDDLLSAFKDKKFKEIILGNRSISFLSKYDGMPTEFVKMFNGNIFCKFYNLNKLRNKNYKYFEVVFPFQISKKLIRKVEENGLEFRCAGLGFFGKRGYWKKINEYSIKHISSDFI